jgi:hypothetical protein
MKEKIKSFFQSEKFKNLNKKVFSKKNFKIALVIIVIAVILRIGFNMLFEVNGIVRKVNGNNITVANFFTTQTINAGDYPVNSNRIRVGDRIKIIKNIQGQVLFIKDGNREHNHGKRKFNSNFEQNNQFNGNGRKGNYNRKHSIS